MGHSSSVRARTVIPSLPAPPGNCNTPDRHPSRLDPSSKPGNGTVCRSWVGSRSRRRSKPAFPTVAAGTDENREGLGWVSYGVAEERCLSVGLGTCLTSGRNYSLSAQGRLYPTTSNKHNRPGGEHEQSHDHHTPLRDGWNRASGDRDRSAHGRYRKHMGFADVVEDPGRVKHLCEFAGAGR